VCSFSRLDGSLIFFFQNCVSCVFICVDIIISIMTVIPSNLMIRSIMYADSAVRTYVSGTVLLLSAKVNACNSVVLTGIYEYVQQWQLSQHCSVRLWRKELESWCPFML